MPLRHCNILFSLLIFPILSLISPAHAKIDLVTLPARDEVQLTIYNAADLTLVRERRLLTLQKGINRLEFSWADTLIDPTSVQLDAPQHRGQVTLLAVSYPPNVTGSAIWQIESQVAGAIPVEISFFTSGLTWRAFYQGTLSPDEQTLSLEAFVRVENHSGEDYADAKTRVVVGKVNLLDEIATLARRHPPYGSPVVPLLHTEMAAGMVAAPKPQAMDEMSPAMARKALAVSEMRPKEIIKEGLSEYFLYTIEGTETIPHGWGKRLPALKVEGIPVKALYRYDENLYGKTLRQFLFFKNDKAHKFSEIPLPDGSLSIYRQLNAQQELSYINQVSLQYIPVGQEVEVNLGEHLLVTAEAVLMGYRTENYIFDRDNRISGYDEIQEWQIELKNNRDIPVDVEIFRHTPHAYWQVKQLDSNATYEKLDMDTLKYRLTLLPRTAQMLRYELTLLQGERQGR